MRIPVNLRPQTANYLTSECWWFTRPSLHSDAEKGRTRKSAVSVAGKTRGRAHVSIEVGLFGASSCPEKRVCLRFPRRSLWWLRGIFCGRAELLEWSQREKTAAEIIVLLVIPLLCRPVIRSSSFKIHHKDWRSPEDSIHWRVTSYFLTGTRLSVGGEFFYWGDVLLNAWSVLFSLVFYPSRLDSFSCKCQPPCNWSSAVSRRYFLLRCVY